MITELVSRLKGRARQRAGSILDFARLVADGKPIDEAALAGALAEVGQTPEAFADLVAKVERRKHLVAELATVPALKSERDAIDKKLSGLAADLEAAQNRYNEAAWPLEGRRQAIAQALLVADTAGRELATGSLDPAALADRDAITAELDAVEAEARELQEVIALDAGNRAFPQADSVDDLADKADRAEYEIHEDQFRDRQRKLRTKIADARRNLTAIEKRRAGLLKRRDELSKTLLIP